MSKVDEYFFLDNISPYIKEKSIDPLFAVIKNDCNINTQDEKPTITFVYSSHISAYLSINEPSPYLSFQVDGVNFFGYDLKQFLKLAERNNAIIYEIVSNGNIIHGEDYFKPVKETILESYIPEKLINHYHVFLNSSNLYIHYISKEFDRMILPQTLQIVKYLLYMHCLENYKILPSLDIEDILINHSKGIPSLSQDLVGVLLNILSFYKNQQKEYIYVTDNLYKPISEWIINSSKYFDNLTLSKKFNESIKNVYPFQNNQKLEKLNKIFLNTVLVFF